MFHLVAVALLGGSLTIGLGWSRLGAGALLLAPVVASLAALGCAVLLDRRRVASAGSWIRDLQAGAPEAAANDRPARPAGLCRRRA